MPIVFLYLKFPYFLPFLLPTLAIPLLLNINSLFKPAIFSCDSSSPPVNLPYSNSIFPLFPFLLLFILFPFDFYAFNSIFSSLNQVFPISIASPSRFYSLLFPIFLPPFPPHLKFLPASIAHLSRLFSPSPPPYACDFSFIQFQLSL